MRGMNTGSLNSPFGAGSADARARGVRTLLIAAVITIALYWIPYAGYATYPIRLLVTFIHEGSHALMTWLTGGWVQSISIQPDGSGLTMSRIPDSLLPHLLVGSAGYLGASLYGAILVGLLRRGAVGNRLLLVTGIAVGLVTLGVFLGLPFTLNVFGLFWGVLITAGLLACALRLPREAADWVAAFVGVQCVLNALFDLKTLFGLSVTSLTPTDAQGMAAATIGLIPAPFWALLWIMMSAAMLWFVLRPMKSPAPVPVRVGR